jgi:hypothetical protein
MNNLILPNIWFAKEERVKSVTKFIALDDKGILTISNGKITFTGSKFSNEVLIKQITNIDLVTQTIPWVGYIIMNVIVIIFVIGITFINSLFAKEATFFGIAYFCMIPLSNLFGITIALSTKWIRMEYKDSKGIVKKDYYADGSSLGWGGIFGGTARLKQIVSNNITTK